MCISCLQMLNLIILIIIQMFSGGFGGFGGFPGFGGMSSEQESAEEPKKQVNTTEYYEMLEVEKTATIQQIRKAFRKKALKQHPDKGGDPDKFKKITHAYEVLSNPEKRQLYDEYGEEGVQNGGPPGGAGFDLFDMFNRKKGPSGPKKGKPKLIPLQVTLNDVYNGCMKKLKIKRTRLCETCDGKGGQNVTVCSKCKGRRVIEKLVQLGPGMYTQSSQKCGECKGTGEMMKEEDRCKTCKGEKIKNTEKELEVAIDSGVPNEHDYIFTGESDEYPGVNAGDIYVRIQIKKHKDFIRKGADLALIKKITLLEALSGVTIDITHLDGKKITIATAPGEILSNGEFKTVRKLGMPFYKDAMSYGNLIIEFLVDFPKKNYFSKEKIDKIIGILGMDIEKPESKGKKNAKILEEYSDADLNPSAEGGEEQEEDHHQGGGGRQEVRCAQQ